MAEEIIPISKAEFAAKFGAVPDTTPVPISRAQFAAKFADDGYTKKSPASYAGRAATGGLQTILNGLTLGWGDEIVGGANAIMDFGTPLDEAYKNRVAQARGMLGEFKNTADESFGGPLSTGIEVASGVALPLEKARSIWQLAKQGAGVGSIYGAGSGEGLEDRATGAGVGAVTGGAIGGTIGAAGKVVEKALNSETLALAKEALSDMIWGENGIMGPAGEAGKLSVSGERLLPKKSLTPEQLQLLDRLKTTAPEELQAAAIELGNAVNSNVPLTLVEALNNPSVTRQARYLANNEATMNPIGEFIEKRSAEAPARISKIASENIAPEKSTFEGGASLKKGAETVDRELRKERSKITKPIYDEAFAQKQSLESPEVLQLLEHPDIKPSVEDARRVIAIRRGIAVDDVAPNSTEVANEVLAELSARGKAAKWQVNDKASYNLAEAQDALESAIYKEVPALKEARRAYADLSTQLKTKVGGEAISMLKDLEVGQLESAGQKLMDLPASELIKVKRTFEAKGAANNLKDGVRAYFQKIIDTQSGGFANNKNVVSKLLGNEQTVQRLKAVLGEDEAQAIIGKLRIEERMFKGAQALHPGSSTAGNLDEAAAFQDRLGKLGKTLDALRHPGITLDKAINKFFSITGDEQLAQSLAQTYITNPAKGLDDLQAILEMQAKRYPIAMDTSKTVGALTNLGIKSTVPAAGSIFQRKK